MPTRRWPRHHRARALGITLLILSLVHAPWPQADFHNVRHQDAPGQVCEHHDHLLRWHPDAGQAEDVAILHWHWFLPVVGPGRAGPLGPRPGAPRPRRRLGRDHARLRAGGRARPLVPAARPALRPAPCSPASRALRPAGRRRMAPGPLDRAGPRLRRHLAPGISLASWLQRWSC